MGLEELRKKLENRNLKNHSSATEKMQQESETLPSYVHYDSMGNQRSIFHFVPSYYGPWMEDILSFLAKNNVTTNTFADHFHIIISDAESWLRWLNGLGYMDYFHDGTMRLKYNIYEIEHLIDGFSYYFKLDSGMNNFRLDHPLDTCTDIIDLIKNFQGMHIVHKELIKEKFRVGNKRVETLIHDFLEMGVLSSYHLSTDTYEVRINFNMISDVLKFIYPMLIEDTASSLTFWETLFKSYWDYPKKSELDNRDCRLSYLEKAFERRGIDLYIVDSFIRLIALCVAEDGISFKRMKDGIQSTPFYPDGCFDNIFSALKRYGFLKHYEPSGYIRSNLSYDEADELLDKFINQERDIQNGKISLSLSENYIPLDIEQQHAEPDDVSTLSGQEFEQYCKWLLLKNGFSEIQDTPVSGDRGVDLIAYKDDVKYAIQCKRYSGTVGNKAVQEAYSGKGIYDADIAVVMTNSTFTSQAIEDAKRLRVKLWDGTYLSSMEKHKSNKSSQNNSSGNDIVWDYDVFDDMH